ncbi:TetR/AcrR family transcriptional regulator [Solimonas fluminis]|nr:TetR/AcrR family transcriptional regulator [Solimonas fluminis]
MRKKPRQHRSRAMVQDLVEAAAITIAEEGLEAATAARIAARAGVSVGSLYQYFDSKEDLYAGVLAQIAGELKAVVGRQLGSLAPKGIRDFVRDLLHDVWTLLEANGGRYMHVSRYWAQLDSAAVMNELEAQMHTALAVYLMQNPPTQPVQELQAKIYVLINSVLFTTVRYISDPAPHVSREQVIETFAAMAAQLVGEQRMPKPARAARRN